MSYPALAKVSILSFVWPSQLRCEVVCWWCGHKRERFNMTYHSGLGWRCQEAWNEGRVVAPNDPLIQPGSCVMGASAGEILQRLSQL